MVKRILILALVFSAVSLQLAAQKVSAKFGDGVKIVAADSSMSLKFGARFQTLFVAEHEMEENAPIEKSMLIRRARLKFEGFAYDPRLTYKLELGLSNRDNGGIDSFGSNGANIILDAIAKYRFAPKAEVWFGQFKLPGNRERVISSQVLQFVDRSLVNSRFNLDRDLGVMLQHKFKLGNMVVKDYWAVSMGQGRDITISDTGGLSYTGRVELLPFGEFTAKGDYFGSDLAREETPKLSVGVGYNYNDEAMRSRGELGSFLPERRDLSTFFADIMLKYQGFSLMSEYMNKQADRDPVLADSTRFFYTGSGFVVQAGYLFKNNIEIAGRYASVNVSEELIERGLEPHQSQYTLGLSKYFEGHDLKIQTDLTYSTFSVLSGPAPTPAIMYRFQLEVAL